MANDTIAKGHLAITDFYRRLRSSTVVVKKISAIDLGSGTLLPPTIALLLLNELAERLLPSTERIQLIFEEILVA
jgi:hypothetical protein